jgi:2-keto-4-pentenoate hydratase
MPLSAAEHLLAARQSHTQLDGLPDYCRPSSIEEGYLAQAELTALIGQPAGWKIACTNAGAMQKMGTDSPFAGPLFVNMLHESPARLDASCFHSRIIEGEFAFRLGRNLSARTAQYTPEEVLAAVESLHPAIEIADSRYREWLSVGVPSLLADGAITGAFVFGPSVSDWHDLDLASWPVRMSADGEVVGEGTGANALGHPLDSLVWFVNHWSNRGWDLRAGELVTTGSCTGNYPARAGQLLSADFGELGCVEVTFL